MINERDHRQFTQRNGNGQFEFFWLSGSMGPNCANKILRMMNIEQHSKKYKQKKHDRFFLLLPKSIIFT